MSVAAGQIAQAAGGVIGSILDARNSAKIAKANIKYQREFAQHGVRWRAEDAKAAGLHPLAALGMQATGFNPVSAPTNFADAGQNVGRAIATALTPSEKNEAEGTLAKLGLERAQLQNDYLRAQIRQINSPGTPPPRPAVSADPFQQSGQNIPPNALVKDEPLKRTIQGQATGQEPGSIVDIGWSQRGGRYFPIPSKDVKDRIEDNPIAQGMHGWRTYFSPRLRPQEGPFPAPRGFAWKGGPIIGYWLTRELPFRTLPSYGRHARPYKR